MTLEIFHDQSPQKNMTRLGSNSRPMDLHSELFCMVIGFGEAKDYVFFSSILFAVSKLAYYMSHWIRFPTMWYVRPAKAQTSLRIRAV